MLSQWARYYALRTENITVLIRPNADSITGWYSVRKRRCHFNGIKHRATILYGAMNDAQNALFIPVYNIRKFSHKSKSASPHAWFCRSVAQRLKRGPQG